MTSADFTVNGNACPPEAVVSFGATVSLALLSTNGVNTVEWSCLGTDAETTLSPVITKGGSPLGSTATFSVRSNPGTGLGASYIIECVVNGGNDSAGQPDSSLRKTAVIGVANSAGVVPISANEYMERSSTHGWTKAVNVALSNVGGTGAPGTPGVLSVDAVVTTNDTLSGTSSRDGVTLTAGTTRVLAVGQTTPSQNGPWLANAGAWTRPSDFSNDAQVVVGQLVFVKPGGASVPAVGQNWQLTVGSTIAGSKTYKPAATAASTVAAVDALATSNVASLSGTTAVDGVTLVAGTTRVLLTAQTTTSQNGPWLAQSSTWTRPLDYATDAQVAAAVGQPVYVKPGGTSIPAEGQYWQQVTGTNVAAAKTFAKQAAGAARAPVRAVQTGIMWSGASVFGAPWVYNAGSGTWTAPANGALGASFLNFDNIATPAVGDRLLIKDVTYMTGVDKSACGIYVIKDVGSAGSKAVLQRATDLDSSADFAGGVSVDVLDGATLKGTRWQLTNVGAITLGTTQLNFEIVSSPATLYIDLSKAPYSIRDYASYDNWRDAGQVDHFRAIDRFLWDYRNVAAYGMLPAANGGLIIGIEPFDHYGKATLVGGGQNVTSLLMAYHSGGHMCVSQSLQQVITNDGFPAIGPTVDTATGATSLSTYMSASAELADAKYYYNLNHAGLLIDDWTQFECRMLIRFADFTNDPGSHIISCRGRRLNCDVDDYSDGSQTGALFSLGCADSTTKKISATMRLTDVTAGVYAATVKTGSGSGTIVGNANVKPLEDAANFTVKIEAAGTAGTPGLKVSWAADGQRFCIPVDMGNATSLALLDYTQYLANADLAATGNVSTLSGEQTIDGTLTSASRVVLANQSTASQNGVYRTGAGAWVRESDFNSDATIAAALRKRIYVVNGTANGGYAYVFAIGTTLAGSKTLTKARLAGPDSNEFDQPFSAMVDLSGTFVAGTTYKIACSGVNQNVSLVSDTVCAINTNYDVCLQYRSNKVYLYVSVAGGAVDTSTSATTGVSATGVLRQRYWETAILGRPMNKGAFEVINDFNAWRGWFGSLRFLSSSVAALSATVTTLYDGGAIGAGVAGQKLCWVPNSNDVRLNYPGTLRRRWRATTEPGRGSSWIVPRSSTTGIQPGEGGIKGLTFMGGTDASQRTAAMLSVAWRGRVLEDIRFLDGYHGLATIGPDFGSVLKDITWSTRFGPCLEFFQGACVFVGRHNWQNTQCKRWAIISTALVYQAGGTFFTNTEDHTRAPFQITDCLGGGFENFNCDAENQILHAVGRELVRCNVVDDATLSFKGGAFAVDTYTCITQVGNGAKKNGQVVLKEFQCSVGYVPMLSSLRGAVPFVLGKGVTASNSNAAPLCDVPNKVEVDGVAGIVPVDGTVDSTIPYADGTVWKVKKDTITANRVYTLSTVGMSEGKRHEIFHESNASYATTYQDAAGNVLALVLASTEKSLCFRLDWTRTLVRRS